MVGVHLGDVIIEIGEVSDLETGFSDCCQTIESTPGVSKSRQ